MPDPDVPDPDVPDPDVPDPDVPDPDVPDPSEPELALPSAPTGIVASLVRRDATSLVLRVSWDPAPSGQEVAGAQVTATGGFAGGSVSRSVMGAGSSADLTLPCTGSTWCDGGTTTITVRATNATGTGPAGSTSYTADRTTPPPPTLVAPSAAGATANANGTVTVSWTLGTPADEHRVVRADTGAVVATVGGSATQAIVSPPAIAPGQTVSFRVDAVHGSEVRSSDPTAPVTAYSVPGAPSGVSVSMVSRTETEVVLDVTWVAAAANGSAVTGYDVTVDTSGGRSRSTSTSTTSARLTVPCVDFCHEQTATARVTATNGAGTGPPGSGSTSVPASPMPKGQALTVSGPYVEDDPRGGGSIRHGSAVITGAQWRAFGGTCVLSVDWDGGTTVPCDGGSVTIMGRACEPWSVTVTAIHESGATVSETHSGHVPQIPGQLCP